MLPLLSATATVTAAAEMDRHSVRPLYFLSVLTGLPMAASLLIDVVFLALRAGNIACERD